MTLNYQTLIDGFANKLIGASGSNTWNDIKFYASSESSSYPYPPWTGNISGPATITGDAAIKTISLTGPAFPDTDPADFRFPDTFQLLDDTTVGISVDQHTPWKHNFDYIMSFVITFRAL